MARISSLKKFGFPATLFFNKTCFLLGCSKNLSLKCADLQIHDHVSRPNKLCNCCFYRHMSMTKARVHKKWETHLILTVNTCIKIVSSIPRKTSFQAFACATVSVPCDCHPSIFSYHLQSSKFISGHLHFKLSKNIWTINVLLCIAPVQTEKANFMSLLLLLDWTTLWLLNCLSHRKYMSVK